MHFGVDGVDGGLRVPVVEGDEPLHLRLRVADEVGADLDLLSLRWKAQEQEREHQCEPGCEVHGGYPLSASLADRSGVRVERRPRRQLQLIACLDRADRIAPRSRQSAA